MTDEQLFCQLVIIRNCWSVEGAASFPCTSLNKSTGGMSMLFHLIDFRSALV